MEDIAQKVFNQVLEIWVLPEIKRRKEKGRMDDKFILRRAQIIFSGDRGWNKIRLNDEVKAIMLAKANKTINKGDPIYETDISSIKNIELTEQDPNAGHITILRLKNEWIISFNFLYNKKMSKERIEAATEFLESAEENMDKNRLRPFFENSYACAELLTEAILITFVDKEKLKDHRSRLSAIKGWAELGNVKEDFHTTLHLLTSLRSSARYMQSTVFKQENPEDIIKVLREMKEFVSKMLK